MIIPAHRTCDQGRARLLLFSLEWFG